MKARTASTKYNKAHNVHTGIIYHVKYIKIHPFNILCNTCVQCKTIRAHGVCLWNIHYFRASLSTSGGAKR